MSDGQCSYLTVVLYGARFMQHSDSNFSHIPSCCCRHFRLGLGAEPRTESAHGVRNLAVAARMERKITGRRRKQANAGSAGKGVEEMHC